MIKLTKLFPILGQSARIKNCPICNTLLKGRNVIKGFIKFCYCTKCKQIVPIELPKK